MGECPKLKFCEFFKYAKADSEEGSLNGFITRYCLTGMQENCIRNILSSKYQKEVVPSNMMPNGLPLPGTKKDGWDEKAKNYRNYI